MTGAEYVAALRAKLQEAMALVEGARPVLVAEHAAIRKEAAEKWIAMEEPIGNPDRSDYDGSYLGDHGKWERLRVPPHPDRDFVECAAFHLQAAIGGTYE